MSTKPSRKQNVSSPKKHLPEVSAILPNGSLVEMLYSPTQKKSEFAIWRDGDWDQKAKCIERGKTIVPYTASNALIKNNVVLFPSEPLDYGSTNELVQDIRAFIHRYVDLSDGFEEIAAHFVLLTWVYDRFDELPYLRVQGEYGTGKTRFLKTIGSLCHRPIIASGASTVSPIFHLLDQFRGTLVIDEADFRFSDETAEIAKIFNCGNTRGMPVLRSQITKAREFEPHVFQVFGPKIVATRKRYCDEALESRFITEHTSHKIVRADIPMSLPKSFDKKALELRNKLLMYRFQNWSKIEPKLDLINLSLGQRSLQIALPMLSLVNKTKVEKLAKAISQHLMQQTTVSNSKLWSNNIEW